MLAVDLLYSFTGILPTDSRPVYSSIIENLLGAIFLNPDMIKIAKTRPTRFFDKIQNFNNRSVIADGIKCETIPSGYRHILDAVRNLKQQLSALTEECNNLRKFNERANEHGGTCLRLPSSEGMAEERKFKLSQMAEVI